MDTSGQWLCFERQHTLNLNLKLCVCSCLSEPTITLIINKGKAVPPFSLYVLRLREPTSPYQRLRSQADDWPRLVLVLILILLTSCTCHCLIYIIIIIFINTKTMVTAMSASISMSFNFIPTTISLTDFGRFV